MIFENFRIDRKSKIGITHLLSNITTREGSHKGGWTKLLKCQLMNLGYNNVKILDNKDNLSNYEIIIFDLGAEFSGTLNLFGGLDEKVYKRLVELKDFKGNLYSWRNDLPSIISLSGRRGNPSSCDQFKQTNETFLEEIQSVLNKCQTFQHAYLTDKLLIGDSHTPSVWTPEFGMIERQDGRTLFGTIRDKIITKIVKKLGPLEVIQIHMSSIDIRHHVCRQSDPESSIYEMLTNLGNELVDLRNEGFIRRVILTETMGIEDESRKLPNTGYYRGTPFFGDWYRRNLCRDYFNEKIKELCFMNNRDGLFEWEVKKFPIEFFDKTGKLKFEVMEKPQSCHLSPEYYSWDLDKNVKRW